MTGDTRDIQQLFACHNLYKNRIAPAKWTLIQPEYYLYVHRTEEIYTYIRM